MTRLGVLLFTALALVTIYSVSASNNPRIQSVEQQQWLKERDHERELEVQRQRELGLHEAKRGDNEQHTTLSMTLLAPLIPAFLMGSILLIYWIYLAARANRRTHFN